MRQVGDQLALGGEQVAYPSREQVDHPAELHHLRRPDRFDPGVQLTLADPVRGLGQVLQRAGDPARQLVGDDEGDDDQRGAETEQDQPGTGHAGPQLLVGHQRADDCAAAARLDRLQHLVAAVGVAGEREPVGRPGHRAGPLGRRPDGATARQEHRGGARAPRVGGVDDLVEPVARPEHPDQQRDVLRVLGGRRDGAVLGQLAHQQRQRHQERDDDERGRGGHQHRELAPHPAGAASRTPTPRTLVR